MPEHQVTPVATARTDERGRAEVWILGLVALGFGLVFLWALVLHEKPPPPRADDEVTTTVSGVPTTVPPPRKFKVIDGVNLREKPAANSAIVGQIPDGSTLLVECHLVGQAVTASVGSSDQWLKTTFNGVTGYVSAVYVDIGTALEDATKVAVCTG